MDGVIVHQAEMGDRFDPALVERSVIAPVGRTLRSANSSPVEPPSTLAEQVPSAAADPASLNRMRSAGAGGTPPAR